MFKWPGGPRKTFPEVRGLKYQFVYLKIRIFRCSHRMTYETPRSKTHKSHDVCIYIYIIRIYWHAYFDELQWPHSDVTGRLDSKGISNPNRIVQQQLSGWWPTIILIQPDLSDMWPTMLFPVPLVCNHSLPQPRIWLANGSQVILKSVDWDLRWILRFGPHWTARVQVACLVCFTAATYWPKLSPFW